VTDWLSLSQLEELIPGKDKGMGRVEVIEESFDTSVSEIHAWRE